MPIMAHIMPNGPKITKNNIRFGHLIWYQYRKNWALAQGLSDDRKCKRFPNLHQLIFKEVLEEQSVSKNGS